MRFLIVVNPERVDLYHYLSNINDHELILLWNTQSEEMLIPLEELPVKFSKVIYWNNYATPKQLIKAIKPDKIIFFEIIDLRQIPLIVTAKALGVIAIFLEHGAAADRNTTIARSNKVTFKNDKLPYLFNRLKNSSVDVFKSKRFYYSVMIGFGSFKSYFKYFQLPVLMLKGAPIKALTNCRFAERTPSFAILFNESNFEELELYTGISKKDVVFTGVPFFDKFYTKETDEDNYIVYIDHPNLEQGILDWVPEHHEKIARNLFQFAEQKRIKIYIKLHPTSKKTIWEKYNYNKHFIEIIQYGDFTDLYLRSKLIISYSSSLVIGFLCARKNVVLLGWHPIPQVFGSDFSQTKLCHLSLNPNDLFVNYDCWSQNNLSIENETLYNNFLGRYNYPFDGKATERVINAIVKK